MEVFATEWGRSLKASADDKRNYTIFKSAPTTWIIAQESCRLNICELAEIYSYEQQKDLRAFIRQRGNLSDHSKSGYWLGGRLTDDEWQWDSEGQKFMSPDNDLYKAGWHFGKPGRRDANRIVPQCLEVQYCTGSKFVESLSWNDLPCEEKKGSICDEIDSLPPPLDANGLIIKEVDVKVTMLYDGNRFISRY